MSGAAPRLSSRPARVLLAAFAIPVCLFLILPVLIIIPMSFSADSFVGFPPPALSWRWYREIFSRREWLDSAWLSVWIACVATLVATVLGTAGAYGLTRGEFPGKRVLLGFILSPLIIPGVIVAIGVYFFYARIHLVGSALAIAMAHASLAAPFVVVNVSAALAGFDPRLEQAARNLGAGEWAVFRLVTLPLIRPGVIAGALFAFITSFDELIVALFVAGPTQVTLPLRMWEGMHSSLDPSIAAVATIAILVSVLLFASAALLQSRVRELTNANRKPAA